MKISWEISEHDIEKVEIFLNENKNSFTEKRKEKNINRQNIQIDENTICKTMIMCLLTSQQKSGPESIIAQLLRKDPFPFLNCDFPNNNDLESFISTTLEQNGLYRFKSRITNFFTSNIIKIRSDNWSIIELLEELSKVDSKYQERKLADKLCSEFLGFGPKQSRNFLQSLGLTKYEIPIDSRIIKWLNKFGFPIHLNSVALSDNGYYHFVSDGFQNLCEKANVYPCILDAAIFSSSDNDGWTIENTVF